MNPIQRLLSPSSLDSPSLLKATGPALDSKVVDTGNQSLNLNMFSSGPTVNCLALYFALRSPL